ncbi:MAG TPA: phosphatidylglycerol lysyltransferase domain-containing protein [Candidatus Saccharimonadales bacterium]|nr:phosphatidylglycerol lysyltransferase domain-containing protein [Candidatus Saccharimonadales bacterium]
MRSTIPRLTDDPFTLAISNGRLYVRTASILTFMSGLSLALEPLFRHSSHHYTNYFLPIGARRVADFTSLFIGLILIYLAYELSQHKHSAWLITLIASAISLCIGLIIDEPIVHGFFAITLIAMLIAGRNQFIVKSHATNLRLSFIALVGSVMFALIYGTLGFWLLDMRDFGINFSLTDAFENTISQYLLIGNGELIPHTRYGMWFLESLSVVGIFTIIYCLITILRPLRYELRRLPAEREQAEALLKKYGGGSDDYFKLWPHDKSFFFSTDGEAFIAYAVSRGVAVSLADPAGKLESISKVLHEFRSFCVSNGWLIAFIAASDQYKQLYDQIGFNNILIGADAIIDIEKFINETSRNKYFRNIANRFNKSGVTAQRYLPPHSPELIEELRYVSNDWLKIPGHKQWQFITGYFSSKYFEYTPLFVVRDDQGRAVAFANELPSFKAGEATVDLMRHKRNAPKNVMDFMFIKLITILHDEGIQQFNLGISPLARQSFSGNSEKLIDYIYLASQRFVSTKGLHQYKSKFDPDWDPRYVYYLGSTSSLPVIGLAVSKLSIYKHAKN